MAVPPVRPHDDVALREDLSALRETASRLAVARADGMPSDVLEREHLRLERAVRARSLHAAGGRAIRYRPLAVDALLEQLGDDTLAELVDVGGRLYVVLAGQGRIRRFDAGTIAEAAKDVDIARFWLTRLAHHVTTVPAEEVMGMLDDVADRCSKHLFGDAAGELGTGAVTVVPSGRLHSVPWSMLPALRHRDVTVAPSAAHWLRCRLAPPPEPGPVVLVRGPGLAERDEIGHLLRFYPDATVLDGPAATAERVVAAIDGAALVHIAAHGTFRAGSPLFSALRLADGPLTVYDLQRIERGPDRIVLSSCDSGLAAAVGADELLGLAASLLPLGTRSIVASVVPVADSHVVPLMVELHRHLRRGAGVAHALGGAQARTATDAPRTAAAWSFVALGVG